jgi:hypothetical protein
VPCTPVKFADVSKVPAASTTQKTAVFTCNSYSFIVQDQFHAIENNRQTYFIPGFARTPAITLESLKMS